MRASSEELALRHAVDQCLPSGGVVVGVSGGADSLALLAATQWVAEHRGDPLTAVVVDHGLQVNSDAIAAQAAANARALGATDVRIERVQVDPQDPDGMEAAARAARRAALLAVMDSVGATSLALGHTREDQAETVLLRLTRGAGVRSLAAMRACSTPWHRPFLDISREQVRAVATERMGAVGGEIWEDPHNSDPRFARVRVRGWLASLTGELGQGVVQGLARTAHLAAADSQALEEWAHRESGRLITQEDGEICADRAELAQLPQAIRTRVIREMYRLVRLPDDSGMDLELDHVEAIDYTVTEWKGQGPTNLPGHVQATIAYGRLCLRRSKE